MSPQTKFDAIIVGGGATGAGIARDLSLRGLKIILLEKNDLAEGTTGRCHAMVHSGARYVFKDKEAAIECAQESQILFKNAPHISDPCDGYFMGVSDEDIAYGEKFLHSCKDANIFCEEVTPEEFLKKEPNCNPLTKRVFRVKDGYVDPFLLTYYNAYDAKLHGAEIRTYSEVQNLLVEGKRIIGVKYYDKLKQKVHNIFASIVINSTGPWAAALEKDLKLQDPIEIAPTMGTLLVIRKRLVNSLINRLRPPGDGDIVVPSHQSVILGTSSIRVKFQDLDHLIPTKADIENILSLGEYLIPAIRKYRLIRFYSGARPLIKNDGPLRDASRKFAIRDYDTFGYSGMITIIGGKMTTYRLMAEQIGNYVCQKLGYHAKCCTADTPLPGGERKVPIDELKADLHVDDKTAFDMQWKWGTLYQELGSDCRKCIDNIALPNTPRQICECENVTESELRWVRTNFDVQVIDDYRRRTRQGMGPCQGQFCFFKVANLEAQWSKKSHGTILTEMKEALTKRWKTESLGDDMLRRQIKLAKYMYLMGGGLE